VSKNDLAIVIVTKNEERNLPRLLASIAANGVKAERVVVVDAHSTDRTAAIARDFGTTVVFERPNLSAQRNAGAKHCGARWLMMLDADMELPSGFVDEVVDLLASGRRCVILPEHSIATSFLAQARGFERDLQHGDLSIEAARAFTSELFWECGGYDEAIGFGGEDWFLAKSMYECSAPARTTRVVLHYEPDSSIPTILRRYFFYGRGRYRLFRTNPHYFVELTNPIRPSARTSWRSYLAHPVLTAGVVFYKALTYGAGLAGFIAEAARERFGRHKVIHSSSG
jgi:glycosyltransferase involved in cell wall biosynthesis